jgi:hypothetical protein
MHKRKFKTILKDYVIVSTTDGFGDKTFDYKHKDETHRQMRYGRYKTRHEAERELVFKAHGIFMEQFSAEQRAKGNQMIAEANKLFDSIYYKESTNG